MAAPALAALARFLPMLEGMAASGGAAGGLGGGVAAAEGGGLMGGLSRLFGTAAFGSEAELGAGLRKISDLSSAVEAAQQAMQANRYQQEEISSKARQDESLYAFSDPAHTEQLAALARQHQAQQQSAQQAQRQMANLQQRAMLTTDPAAMRAAKFGQAATVLGAGAAVASMAPSLIRNSTLVVAASNMAQAGANLGGNFMTPATAGIAGQALGTGGRLAGAFNPLSVAMNPLKSLSEGSVEIAKLPMNLQNWSQALIDSQKVLARWSPALSKMVADEERRGIIRGARSAQTTAGATSDLSDAMQDLLDTLQPIKDTVTVAMARGLTMAVQFLAESVEYLESIWEYVKTLPGADLIDAKMKGMELDSRIKAGNAIRPLITALRDLEKRDKSTPRGVPKR